jgi:hypothetical protein
LDAEGTTTSTPVPRANHSLAWLGSRLLLLGGVGASGELRGLHLLENTAAVKVGSTCKLILCRYWQLHFDVLLHIFFAVSLNICKCVAGRCNFFFNFFGTFAIFFESLTCRHHHISLSIPFTLAFLISCYVSIIEARCKFGFCF